MLLKYQKLSCYSIRVWIWGSRVHGPVWETSVCWQVIVNRHVLPKLWNALPLNVRVTPTLITFKSRIKTFYFFLAFNTINSLLLFVCISDTFIIYAHLGFMYLFLLTIVVSSVNVSVTVEESQTHDAAVHSGMAALAWNITAPCKLEVELHLCKKPSILSKICYEFDDPKSRSHQTHNQSNPNWKNWNRLWVRWAKMNGVLSITILISVWTSLLKAGNKM